MWRCVKNIWGYCKGTPKWSKKPEETYPKETYPFEIKPSHLYGECSLNPKTCKNHCTLGESTEALISRG